MPDPDLVKTGIAGLDDILPNGIPRGNVILVEGAIGAGKTTMGVEFVYRGASQFDEPGIIVVFEVSPDKIMRDALGLGWDLRKLEELRKLKIVFTTREVLRQELQQADSVLLEEAAEIGARRIFIDGVGRLVGSNGGPESRSAFHVLTEGLQRENLTALLAVEASSLDGSAPASLPEESIAGDQADGGGAARGQPLHRDCEIARPGFSDGAPLVPHHRWQGHPGVSPRSGASKT